MQVVAVSLIHGSAALSSPGSADCTPDFSLSFHHWQTELCGYIVLTLFIAVWSPPWSSNPEQPPKHSVLIYYQTTMTEKVVAGSSVSSPGSDSRCC